MSFSSRVNARFDRWLRARVLPIAAEANEAPTAELTQNLAGGFDGAQEAIRELRQDLGRAHAEIEETRNRVRDIEPHVTRTSEISRHIYDEEPANRRRLHALRDDEDYELAFSEAEPLVSFIVPTYNSYETLRDRCLPSILSQTYSNLEVIVVGDASPPETAAVIAEIDDPRVRFYNRTVRGPYPEDLSKRWYVIGTPPYDDALALAKGRWIAGLGDDDEIRPDHTHKLLAAAQADRLEHCYGHQLVHFPDGGTIQVGAFPPQLGTWGLQAAIFHAGLRFFELELTDVIYREPNDWSLCRRMVRAGVRFGMIDDVVCDKHEMRRSDSSKWGDGSVPRVE